MLKKTVDALKRVGEKFIAEETINDSKVKWNKLAEKNARFFIASKLGEGITEEQFRAMGAENYHDVFASDSYLRELLGGYSDKDMLEIGSGTGRMTEFFAKDFKKVTGIDISETMVEQARARLAAVSNAEFVATDGVHYPFADNSFDFVFSYIVFQHMPNRAVVAENFKEVFRVLKPGRVAKIQIRGGHQPFRWQWFHGPAFKKEEALAMVEKTGFRVLKTAGENQKLFWLWLTK